MTITRFAAAVVAGAGALALALVAAPPPALAAGVLTELTWDAPGQQTVPPSGWTAQVARPNSAQVVTTPTRAGGHSVRIQLNRTDPDVQSSKRAELVKGAAEPATGERWYGFSIYLPTSSWKQHDVSAEVLTQWHHAGNTGSPPLALVTRNGSWEVDQVWENYNVGTPIGAYQVGHWTDWVFHVKWSPGTGGLVEAWKDGTKVFTHSGKNKYDDGAGVYMKFGIYKWDWKSNPAKSTTNERILFADELRIADQTGSYTAVAPH